MSLQVRQYGVRLIAPPDFGRFFGRGKTCSSRFSDFPTSLMSKGSVEGLPFCSKSSGVLLPKFLHSLSILAFNARKLAISWPLNWNNCALLIWAISNQGSVPRASARNSVYFHFLMHFFQVFPFNFC